jgi:uncharacterized RDD family membrane protein YckC
MENEGKTGSGEVRPRYVWDRDKLEWVEATEAPAAPAAGPIAEQEEGVVEATLEGAPEEAAGESVPVEAVVETGELVYKGALLRLVAILIDVVILSVVVVIVDLITSPPPWTGLILGFIYFVGFWTWRGQTPGKMIVGARIVKSDGTAIGFPKALLRYLFYLIPSYAPILVLATLVPWFGKNMGWLGPVIGLIGIIIVGLNQEKRGLHDIIAGTIVINTRGKGQTEPAEAEQGEAEPRPEPDAAKQA